MTKIPNFNSDQLNIKDTFEPEEEVLLSISKAAKILNIPIQYLSKLSNEGIFIPASHTSGGHRRYSMKQIQKFEYNPNTLQVADELEFEEFTDTKKYITFENDNSNEIMSYKALGKISDVFVTSNKDKPEILILLLGMLIVVIIKLISFISENTDLLLSSHRLQEDYLRAQQRSHDFNSQGVEKRKIKSIQTKKYNTQSLWEKSVKSAHEVYEALVRSTHNGMLDKEERKLAEKLLSMINKPFISISKHIAEFNPGTMKHEVSKLILLTKPIDYAIDAKRWSVRRLSKICKKLGVKSASKSNIGRFLKEIGWSTSIKPKLLSPDPNYGDKMLNLGMKFASIRNIDKIYYLDEMKYTSSKVAEYMKRKVNISGLDITLPFAYHKPFYKEKVKVQVFGMLDAKKRKLHHEFVEQMNFDSFYKILTTFINDQLNEDFKNKIFIVLDNAPYHKPIILSEKIRLEYKQKVELIFLPKYGPNHNLIERFWKIILDMSTRLGETETELKLDFSDLVEKLNEQQSQKALKMHCGVCSKKWIFDSETDNTKSLKKHLCFRIKGLNPYTMYILKHSLENINLGQEVL